MQSDEVLQTECALELAKRFSRPRCTRQVVAGGKNVRGVEADAEPFRLAHVRQNVGEMVEGMTERGALTRGCFERDARLHLRDAGEDAVDRPNHLLQPGL